MDLVDALRKTLEDYDARTRMKVFDNGEELVGIVGDNLVAMQISNSGSRFMLKSGEVLHSSFKRNDMMPKENEIDLSKVDTKETIN